MQSTVFFDEQLNLDDVNRFSLLSRGDETKSPSISIIKNNFISGVKFLSININGMYKG